MKNTTRWTAMTFLTAGLIAPTLAAAPADASAGAKHTSITADINGDGHPELVTATKLPDNHVRFTAPVGHGVKVQRTIKLYGSASFAKLDLRAGHMDGERGDELVYNVSFDHTGTDERVLTLRHGKLVYLPAPITDLWGLANNDDQVYGFKRHIKAHGQVVVNMLTAVRKGDHYKTWNSVYIWVDGQWKDTGKLTISRTNTNPADTFAGFTGSWGRLPRYTIGVAG